MLEEPERIETRVPVRLKVYPGGEESVFLPGTTFTVLRFLTGEDPLITAADGTQLMETEDSIRKKIALREMSLTQAEKRSDTWRAVVTGVTIGVVLKLVDLAGWALSAVFNP